MKEDPLLGPSLLRFIRGKYNQNTFVRQMKIHFQRAGINYDELKDYITVTEK